MYIVRITITLLSLVTILFLAVTGCTPEKPVQGEANSQSYPGYVRKDDSNNGVIIFVHGFTSNATDAWTNSDTNSYWPDLLVQDPFFEQFNIYVYEYPTTLFDEALSIDEIAGQMNEFFEDAGIYEHDHIVFIAHSMGGLITRTYLNNFREIENKVEMIYFYGTPTNGSHLANLAKVFVSNPQINQMVDVASGTFLSTMQTTWRAAQHN